MLLDFFHKLVIPFLGGFVVTLGKCIADQKLLTLDESNDIALDLVLIAVGAVGVLFAGSEASGVKIIPISAKDVVIDGGIVDALLGMILLYLRWERRSRATAGKLPKVGLFAGIAQLTLGLAAIIWTVNAF